VKKSSLPELLLADLDERIHEVVVLLSLQSLMVPADVERVLEKLFVVRSHIQNDGEDSTGMYSSSKRVDDGFGGTARSVEGKQVGRVETLEALDVQTMKSRFETMKRTYEIPIPPAP